MRQRSTKSVFYDPRPRTKKGIIAAPDPTHQEKKKIVVEGLPFICSKVNIYLLFQRREGGGKENTDLMEPKRKESLLSSYICLSLENYLI